MAEPTQHTNEEAQDANESTVRVARAKAALDDELARWLLEAQRAAARELGGAGEPLLRRRYRGRR